MKALSIRQPWAWLIVNGFKDIENRSWPTNFRGRIYVHTGKKMDPGWFPGLFQHVEGQNIRLPFEYALGAIVGEVDIVECVTESASPWFSGPYGFLLACPLAYETPVPYRGRLSFFEVTPVAEPQTGRGSLGHQYRAAGLYQEAIQHFKEELAKLEGEAAKDHPKTLRCRSSLANGYYAAGHYGEAIRLFQETLEIRRRVLGLEHPDTVRSLSSLANSYRTAGRYLEAIKLYREVLTARARTLGPDHPRTLSTRRNLAEATRAAGLEPDA